MTKKAKNHRKFAKESFEEIEVDWDFQGKFIALFKLDNKIKVIGISVNRTK